MSDEERVECPICKGSGYHEEVTKYDMCLTCMGKGYCVVVKDD